MKPATAAKKLDVYLPATPAEFQQGPITRAELAALQADPPEWLRTLRADGPHPKNLVAEMPDWLAAERATQIEVRREERRVKSLHADKQRARDEADADPEG